MLQEIFSVPLNMHIYFFNYINITKYIKYISKFQKSDFE